MTNPFAHAAAGLLETAFGNSPFLARLALRERGFLAGLLVEGPDAAFETIVAPLPPGRKAKPSADRRQMKLL